MKKLTLMGSLAGALLATSGMQAVTISLTLQEGALAPLTASSTTGVVSVVNTTYDDFVLHSVTGLGTPFYSTPELNLQTLNVTSANLTAPVTLTIKLTETGLTPAGPSMPVLNAFTGILAGVSSETISSYYDTTDAAYGTGTLLAQTTFNAPGANSMNFPGTIIASALYSESEIITATFAPSGSDTLSSNAHTTAAVVPEPLSMGLLGSGLLCVGVLRWRRRKS